MIIPIRGAGKSGADHPALDQANLNKSILDFSTASNLNNDLGVPYKLI